MLNWPNKDPDEVLDYRWNVNLDPDDTLLTAQITLVDGAVTIDNQDRDDTGLTVWLSGGTIGNVLFRALATTADGRTFEDYIGLQIVENNPDTGGGPAASAFRIRFPEFAAVPYSTVSYWLTDAGDPGFTNFIDADQPKAVMLLAAHNMARAGLLASDGDVPAGVTSLRSGSLSLTFDATAAKNAATGDYASTRYGQELLLLTGQNSGGMRATGSGEVVGVWGGYLSGLHPSW